MPETLIAALTELEEEYVKAQADPAFKVRRFDGKEDDDDDDDDDARVERRTREKPLSTPT